VDVIVAGGTTAKELIGRRMERLREIARNARHIAAFSIPRQA